MNLDDLELPAGGELLFVFRVNIVEHYGTRQGSNQVRHSGSP